MISRRTFLASLAAFATGAHAAQERVIAVCHPILLLSGNDPLIQRLLAPLAAQGYRVGGSLRIEARTIRGDLNRIPDFISDIRSLAPDVIVSGGYPLVSALRATGIPVVAAFGVGDPVATGMIESIAHPGGNVTGVYDDVAALTAKRMQLLKEISPSINRVAMLWNKDDRAMTMRFEASASVAASLGLVVLPQGVRAPDDFNQAFAAMDADPPDAILLVADALTNLNRGRVIAYAERRRLPAIYEQTPIVRVGGLMSYAAEQEEGFERAGALSAKIFHGSQAGDLPFEQATRYRLSINLKTASALGLVMPPSLLARADEVIE